MSGALLDHDNFSVKVLRSEWAVMPGANMVESVRTRGIMWLYQKSLRSSILRVGLRAICHGSAEPDERAANVLGALLALLDKLPVGPTVTHRFGLVPSERRARSFRMSVVVKIDGSVMEAKVDGDLLPLEFSYSADFLEGPAVAA